MLVTYAFYRDTYGGKEIAEDQWSLPERKAEGYLHSLTYHRLQGCTKPPENVKLAVCAVAEVIARQEAAAALTKDRPGLRYFENDGYREDYLAQTEVQEQFKVERWEAAGVFLPLSHPLRYAGV